MPASHASLSLLDLQVCFAGTAVHMAQQTMQGPTGAWNLRNLGIIIPETQKSCVIGVRGPSGDEDCLGPMFASCLQLSYIKPVGSAMKLCCSKNRWQEPQTAHRNPHGAQRKSPSWHQRQVPEPWPEISPHQGSRGHLQSRSATLMVVSRGRPEASCGCQGQGS